MTKRWTTFPPLLAAFLSSALALAGAGALGSTLRHRAAAASRELPRSTRSLFDATSLTPDLIAHGRRLYLNSCARCHGDDARGDEGPDLHGLEISDRCVATVIKQGIKGEMPSFRKKYSDTDVLALITYLRILDRAGPLGPPDR